MSDALPELVNDKRAARRHRGVDRLATAVPAAHALLQGAGTRGDNIGAITTELLRLLDRYGADELDAAIREALERGVRSLIKEKKMAPASRKPFSLES